MTLQATILASRLDALVANASTEAAATEAWAEAFTSYFEGGAPPNPATGAIAGAVPVTAASLRTFPAPATSPKGSMKSSLAGMSTTAAGTPQAALKIAAGLSAFWAAMAGGATSFFSGATAITPPAGLATLATTLQTTFDNNKSSNATKTAALQAIANDIHAANAGGIATFPTPVGPQTIT